MSITEATSTVDIYIASAQTQGEKVLAAEVVRLRAEVAKIGADLDTYRVSHEMACEEPASGCECAGCMRAQEYNNA